MTVNLDHENLRVIDAPAVADLLGVSRFQLGEMTRAGEIGHVRLGRGQKRAHVGYLRRHIEEFLAAREVAPK